MAGSVHDIHLVQVKAPSDVKEKWDYYNVKWDYYDVKETIPADEAFQLLSTSKCRLVTK
jgi:branched-chain amino acid transport system substrate-binding protein